MFVFHQGFPYQGISPGYSLPDQAYLFRRSSGLLLPLSGVFRICGVLGGIHSRNADACRNIRT